MVLAATDPVALAAFATAAGAVVSSFLAYKRGRHADERSIAVTELELTVRTMQGELDRRGRENDALRVRIEACEEDRRKLWERNGELRAQIRKLEAGLA